MGLTVGSLAALVLAAFKVDPAPALEEAILAMSVATGIVAYRLMGWRAE